VENVKKIIYSEHSERDLRAALGRLHENDAVLSYYQLYGFLFAMACAPEPIKPSEWFELIWLDDEPQFDSSEEARGFYQLVVALAVYIEQSVELNRQLPFGGQYADQWQSELAQWCDGLLMGHMYLEELWDIALQDLSDADTCKEVDIVLNLASTFADLDDARQLSFEEGMELTDDHLPEAYELFCKVLAVYASVAGQWGEVKWEMNTEQMFLALEPVPRDTLCPCGSGIVFAKCCLH